MNLMQKWVIAAILMAPLFIGTVLLFHRDRGSLSGGLSLKRLGLVSIKGTIMESDEYVRQLQSLRLDKTVAGVILRIDSPGGAVAPSQEIYAEVMKYRRTGKPVAVSMGSVAASGGYYIASPATRIFADPGTLT
ncbi:MAG: S49 family peptidase, partial [Chitinispirillaceae bacterium]|nr:S49 family peptidase [Chitinispirillaceae bacterium]